MAERDPFQTYGGFLEADPVYGTGKGGRPSRRSEQVWPGGGGGPLVRNPVDSGETAASWYYEITNKNNTITISFHNSNIQNGVPIAILLQYGHGTGTGGWVQGRDYINPAIQPIFDQIAEYAWKEVTRS